jgi:CubicO group peptidase (beta-lactamase class C family)
MDQVLQAYAADGEFMGAVLVCQGDSVLVDKGYGSANLEWNIPNSPTTRFWIGSLVKQFTAAAVLLLEERGKLKLDDPVRTYLPDAPASWDRITLFNLLTQTSGIHDYTDTPDFGSMMQRRMTPEQLIATFRDMPLEFTPGEKFSYSNSNYVLLGSLIEKISGTSYVQFMQDNLFSPLGMKDSGYDSGALLPRRAAAYVRKDGTLTNAPYTDMSILYPGGALYSTTHDLLTWERALFGGKVLSPASLIKMTTPFRTGFGPGAPFKSGYAMGLYVGTTVEGRREVSHTGSGPGVTSILAAYPDDKLYVIVLSNTDGWAFADIASKLADISFGKQVILRSERKQIAVDAKTLARYVGRYQLKSDLLVAVTQDGNALFVKLANQPQRRQLYPQSNTSFYTKDTDAQVDFQVSQGTAIAFLWQEYGRIVNAPRVAGEPVP